MAVQSSFRNMTLCLFAVCIVSSALLAAVYAVTKEPIEAAEHAKTVSAIAQVVPEFDGEPVSDTIEVAGKKYPYYAVSKGGQPVGYAITTSASGYGGAVTLMVGITADRVIYNTTVLSQAETPGLGAKCTEPEFADQFRNWNPAEKALKVKKDGGDVDAITASTITSRAYALAVETAVMVYDALAGQVPADGVTGATNTEAGTESDAAEAGVMETDKGE